MREARAASLAAMPPRRRRPQIPARQPTTVDPTEQTPLLTTGTRGRVRIHGDTLTPRPGPPGHLSRNQSYTGMCRHIPCRGPSSETCLEPSVPCWSPEKQTLLLIALTSYRRKYAERQTSQPSSVLRTAAYPSPLRSPGNNHRIEELSIPRRARVVRPVHLYRLGARQHRRRSPGQGAAEPEGPLGPHVRRLLRHPGVDPECPEWLRHRDHRLHCQCFRGDHV